MKIKAVLNSLIGARILACTVTKNDQPNAPLYLTANSGTHTIAIEEPTESGGCAAYNPDPDIESGCVADSIDYSTQVEWDSIQQRYVKMAGEDWEINTNCGDKGITTDGYNYYFDTDNAAMPTGEYGMKNRFYYVDEDPAYYSVTFEVYIVCGFTDLVL